MPDLYEEADLYGAAFDFPLEAEVDWLLDQGGAVRSVLEPMCGNARYGRVFAKRGVRYHGVDLSPQMLERAPAARNGFSLTRADSRTFSLDDGPFDMAWCAVNSIRHLSCREDLIAHLGRVRDHLAPDGLYIVESDMMRHDGPWEQGPDDRSQWSITQPDGSEVRSTWSIDRCDLERRLVWERARIERIAEGRVVQEIEHVYEMSMVTADDWPRLAEAGGFRIERIHAHHAGNRRPQVDLSPALENSGENYYLLLRKESRE